MGGTFGGIDPLSKVPFKRAIIRLKKGPLFWGVSLILRGLGLGDSPVGVRSVHFWVLGLFGDSRV